MLSSLPSLEMQKATGLITNRELVRHYAQNDSDPMNLRCRELAVGNPVHVSQFASLECTLQLMRVSASTPPHSYYLAFPWDSHATFLSDCVMTKQSFR